MTAWLCLMLFATPPPGANNPDLSSPGLRRADSLYFAWQVTYYERIIPWHRPNAFLLHPQIQQCLGYTLKNGRVIFPISMSYEQRARRLQHVWRTYFLPARVLQRCGFIPQNFIAYLKYGRAFIPLDEKVRHSVLLHTLWTNVSGGFGLLILKNVKRRWVTPWEKAWKAGYRSVFTGEILETLLPPDTFLGRLDKNGKVRVWSVLGPSEGGTIMGRADLAACKPPPASQLMLIAYIPFPVYPHKDTTGLPGAIRTTVSYRLEVVADDTLLIRWCDYLEPLEIWTSNSEKRIIRFESDTTRLEVVRRMVAEIEGWVEKVRRGEVLVPVKVPPPKDFAH
ncbi:MAG: hypothetical protein L3J76_05625 [Candidatus Hydrothermae bacterium]|nr:hypothetical protein [Candidatus Hydrothermae bacterium]